MYPEELLAPLFRGLTDRDLDLYPGCVGALIGLARATENNWDRITAATDHLVAEGLCAGPDRETQLHLQERIRAEKQRLCPDCFVCPKSCGRIDDYDMTRLRTAPEEVRRLKALILCGIRGAAACIWRAALLDREDPRIYRFLYRALYAIGMDDWDQTQLLPLALEAAKVHLQAMALLDQAGME